MSLLVAVQNALDIALHMASDEGWGVPASYAESFGILARQGVVIERSTLSFWMGYAAAEVAPVVARLREMMLASTRIRSGTKLGRICCTY